MARVYHYEKLWLWLGLCFILLKNVMARLMVMLYNVYDFERLWLGFG